MNTENKRTQIEQTFTYHAPKGDQTERYLRIREAAKAFALLVLDLTPESREQSLALTHIQEASMFANASIACHE